MKFSKRELQLVALLGVAGLLYILFKRPPAAPAKVTKTITIDSNVLSPTFGLEIDEQGNVVNN